MPTFRVRVDDRTSERRAWGAPHGIPEGTDFTLESTLTVNGVTSPSAVTSSGAYTLTVSDSVLNSGVALLSAVAGTFSSASVATGLVTWSITDANSSGWEAGTYTGDIKLTDSGSKISQFPISLSIRESRG